MSGSPWEATEVPKVHLTSNTQPRNTPWFPNPLGQAVLTPTPTQVDQVLTGIGLPSVCPASSAPPLALQPNKEQNPSLALAGLGLWGGEG